MKESNNIARLAKSECCGCRACGDVCPKNCISFAEDDEGFFYPSVNEESCVSCGKCVNICPEINVFHNSKVETVEAAYAKNAQQRKAGTSGGVFGLLAEAVINDGGVVWGAAFDDDLQLVHCCARTLEELKPLYKSKYLQSNTSGIYSKIIKDAKDGKHILFSGTPCQCNAVRNVVGKYNENLITVEVVCHGVPSQSLFDKCIKWVENKRNFIITDFRFRSKHKYALSPRVFTYKANKNGTIKTIRGIYHQFPFLFGFYKKYMTLRPACYDCKWACPNRCADITLGDFWGIEKYNSELDTKIGVSEVIVSTDKGESLMNQIKESGLLWSQKYSIETALNGNSALTTPTPVPNERKSFFHDLRNDDFDLVVQNHLTSKKKWIFDILDKMPDKLSFAVCKLMKKLKTI